MEGLSVAVHLRDPSGRIVTLRPGDEVPSWAVDQIRNRQVWSGNPPPGHTRPVEEPEVQGPPPQQGPGSSRAAWAAYAASSGVDLDGDPARDDIIDACRQAGVATE